LRALPAATVENFALSSSSATGLITDGQILPVPAIVQYQTGNFNHVPVLVGDAENEGAQLARSTAHGPCYDHRSDRSTTTTTGLKVKAVLDTTTYEKGIKITAAEMKRLNIQGEAFHPEWNYSVKPRSKS